MLDLLVAIMLLFLSNLLSLLIYKNLRSAFLVRFISSILARWVFFTGFVFLYVKNQGLQNTSLFVVGLMLGVVLGFILDLIVLKKK